MHDFSRIFVLEGSGATEIWQDNGPKHLFEWSKWRLFAPPDPKPYESGHEDQVIVVNRKEGGIYGPPGGWYHQHFNTGSEPARHLALRMGGRVYPTGFYSCLKKYDDAVMTALKDGGTMIDYDEEDPEIKVRFEQSLEKNGIPVAAQPVGNA